MRVEGPLPNLGNPQNWQDLPVPMDWKEWASRNGIYDHYLELPEGMRFPDDFYRDGRPFRPNVDVLGLPDDTPHRDILINLLDRILTTSYMPSNPWHRLAYRWLMFMRWQQYGGHYRSRRVNYATYQFDLLQNEDGSPRILANPNFESAEASQHDFYPHLDEDDAAGPPLSNY